MGFPILPVPYGGVVSKLLFTAGVSMAAIRNLCNSLLKTVGLSFFEYYEHTYNYQPALSPHANDDESWYNFNPQVSNGYHQPPATASSFIAAAQASLPAMLYEDFILNNMHSSQVAGNGAPSSLSSSSSSLSSAYSSFSSSSPSHHGLSQSAQPAVQLSNNDPSLKLPAPTAPMDRDLQSDCAVCLCEFTSGQQVRVLPRCHHIFHEDCIDGWLRHNHCNCPLCRTSVLTPAMALQLKMREQEISEQIYSWLSPQEEEAYGDLIHHPHHSQAANYH